MIDIVKDLGVQSFCYRGFETNEEVAAKVKETGLSKIEVCRKHANFSDESVHEAVAQAYSDAGVEIVSIGVETFAGNEEKEESIFKFAKMVGCKSLAGNFALNATPDSYRIAEILADKYDINIGIHNHGGHHWLGTSDMLAHVFAQTSPRIGLCLDTAWAIDARQEPVQMVEKFADRLYGLHFKDFIYERVRKPVDVVCGDGLLDLQGLLAKLKEIDFNGYAVLEYEADVDNPVPALKKCADKVKAEAAKL